MHIGMGFFTNLWNQKKGPCSISDQDRGIHLTCRQRMYYATILGVMLCLQGCTFGSHFRNKKHLISKTFIPLHRAPSLTCHAQNAMQTCIPTEYQTQRHRLEKEQQDLGSFSPIFSKALPADFAHSLPADSLYPKDRTP